MNSSPEERVELVEKEGVFTRLAEENIYRRALLRPGSLLVEYNAPSF
jgi:DNA topoisomerase VI subunit A